LFREARTITRMEGRNPRKKGQPPKGKENAHVGMESCHCVSKEKKFNLKRGGGVTPTFRGTVPRRRRKNQWGKDGQWYLQRGPWNLTGPLSKGGKESIITQRCPYGSLKKREEE